MRVAGYMMTEVWPRSAGLRLVKSLAAVPALQKTAATPRPIAASDLLRGQGEGFELLPGVVIGNPSAVLTCGCQTADYVGPPKSPPVRA